MISYGKSRNCLEFLAIWLFAPVKKKFSKRLRKEIPKLLRLITNWLFAPIKKLFFQVASYGNFGNCLEPVTNWLFAPVKNYFPKWFHMEILEIA